MPLHHDLRADNGPGRGCGAPRPTTPLHAPVAVGVALGMDDGSRSREGPWRIGAPQFSAIATHILKNEKTTFLPKSGSRGSRFGICFESRAGLAGRRDHVELALSYVAISDVRLGAVLLVHPLYWHRVGGDSRDLLIRRGVGSFAAGLCCAPSRCLAAELGSSPFLGALLEFLPVAARCPGLEPITKRIKIRLVVAG